MKSWLQSSSKSAKAQAQTEVIQAIADGELVVRPKLREFIDCGEPALSAWTVLEPTTPFKSGWHLDVICEHLEAVSRGDIRNLIINIPPRHMKSLAVCVFWPVWEWIEKPSTRWLFNSYAATLATRDSIKCRRLIESPVYQALWGSSFRLSADNNQKTRFENDKTGYRIALGVGGGATGEGGDRIVVDDPHKAREVHSDDVRGGTIEWWDGTMSTRANDPETASRVIVMQRLHEGDLTGHALNKMREQGSHQYDHLCLPARYEARTVSCPANLRHDPRTQEGELLWPERFSDASLRQIEADLGERETPGQLQQRPTSAKGGIFLKEWWADGRNRYDADDTALRNKCVGRYISFDTAVKDEEQNDYTAWVVAEMAADWTLNIRWIEQRKLQSTELAGLITRLGKQWNFDGKLNGIIVEDKGSGTFALQSLRKAADPQIAPLLQGFDPKQMSKTFRARQASDWCERDCIKLPFPSPSVPWLYAFENDEAGPDTGHLYKFPAITHDDDVDAFVQQILFLENLLAVAWKKRQGHLVKRGVR